MTKLTEEQLKMLRSPLPKEAISQHPTKTFLSTIKAIYVVERLNQVFGIGNWNLKSEIIDNATSMIVVKSILTIPEYNIELESYGGNNNGGENSKNFDLGDAYKGATTDALTKICSYLEIGIDVFKGNGNKASYNEGKENVIPKMISGLNKAREISAETKKKDIMTFLKNNSLVKMETKEQYQEACKDMLGIELNDANLDNILKAINNYK